MTLFLKNLVFTLLVPGVVAVLIPLWLAPPPELTRTWLLLASPFFALGAAIYFWCVWDFATFGRGTPAPIDAPKHLVVRGLYRYSRNPMYVGVLTTIAGWAVFFGAPWQLLAYLAAVAIAFHLRVVLHEEPHLSREFGSEYQGYCARVGRWFPKSLRRRNP